MMEALLKGFVPEEWVNDLDFKSLYSLNFEHILDDLSTRHSDVICKINYKNIPLYVLCLVEFQTTSERFMAARLITYIGLIYQDLIAKKDPFIAGYNKLPPVFPLVFYNGSTPWNAPLTLKDCIVDFIPDSLKKYQPEFEYALLDIGHLSMDQYSVEPDNLVVPIIELERSVESNRAIRVANELANRLKGSEFDSLRRAMIEYIDKAIMLPESTKDVLLTNLQEVNTMLSENVERWKEEFKQEGLQEGRQKGLQEGRQEGQIEWLIKLLKAKSGTISPKMLAKIKAATTEELNSWFNQLLESEKVEQ